MFWQKEELSPKELYTKEYNRIVNEAIDSGGYKIRKSRLNDSDSYIFELNDKEIGFKNQSLRIREKQYQLGFGVDFHGNPTDYETKHFYYEITGYKNLHPKVQKIFLKYLEEMDKKIDFEEERKQNAEDEVYRNKLRELLKTKPLDKDLKESFKKAERLLEIAEEIKKLREEMLELRK